MRSAKSQAQGEMFHGQLESGDCCNWFVAAVALAAVASGSPSARWQPRLAEAERVRSWASATPL